MPFVDDEPLSAPLSLPENFNLNPDAVALDGSVLGAAFRTENPIASALSGYEYDTSKPFDPDYRPWDDIQGTLYENYSDRFTDASDATDVRMMKAQIDREMEDRAMLDAAGGWGMLAQVGAAILSPTSLLPGGAIVKGARGISIARTGLSVSVAAGTAATIDEAVLQLSQQTRSGAESGLAIGGSMILGGLLGTAAGSMSRKAFNQTAKVAGELPAAIREFDDTLRSMGAADVSTDMTLRREQIFQAINSIPLLRGIVRSDPILRAQLSTNKEVRSALPDLVETPLQYMANEAGEVVTEFGVSAETAIKTRKNTQLAESLAYLKKSFSEYTRDGAVGFNRFTAPITAKYGYLLGLEKKMGMDEFMREVGVAAMRSDTHPIAQVAKAAQEIRTKIFDAIKEEAIDLGIFDEDLQLKYGTSYFMRVYNNDKISKTMGDGSADDIYVMLNREFKRKRTEAETRLAFDRTVSDLENQKDLLKQTQRQAQSALNKANKKAKAKKSRAEGAVKRENAVGRATGALRKAFLARSEGLSAKTLEGSDRANFAAMVKDARRADKLEPQDMLSAIRRFGGIKDNQSAGKGNLKSILDTRYASIVRKNGVDIDYMRGYLVESGYLDEGATIDDLLERLRDASNGEKIYSQLESGQEIARYEATKDFRDALDEAGIDFSKGSVDDVLNRMPGFARNQAATRAKSEEAGRSANKAGEKVDSAEAKLLNAIDRLEEANARLAELDDIAGPRVRNEIKAAQADLQKLLPELKKAKSAQSADEFYARLDDLEIQSEVEDAVNSILGLKPGEHSYRASMSSATRARVLDVHDEVLEPWLETDMGAVLYQYFNGIVPDMEIIKRFGDLDLTKAKQKILDQATRDKKSAQATKASKGKVAAALDWITEINDPMREAEIRTKELQAMADRLRGVYGAPKDPKDQFVRGARMVRTLSYTGYLGGMTLAAMPDVANIIGRNGIESAFGSLQLVTDPKRFKVALKDAQELGAAAEWHLNSRSVSMAEVMDPYGLNTSMERGLGKVAQVFGFATGMIPWNAGWKSVGGAFISSKMAKAADAVAKGKATKKNLIALSENGIDRPMAQRIAKQMDEFGDKDGLLWLPQGGKWTDQEAFEAFRYMMNREIDLMVVTPGQDKPLMFSNEVGKFFSQFKTFVLSAHHRVLLSGIQRSDGAVLAQFVTAIMLGKMVSNVKADLGGYDRKEGAAAWEDAIDRSGMAGWLFEAHGVANGALGGKLSFSGEEVSRFQSRSQAQGLLGPSIDMAVNVYEAGGAVARGKHSYRDARKLMRPIPGNNIPYILPLFRKIEEEFIDITGGKPRS